MGEKETLKIAQQIVRGNFSNLNWSKSFDKLSAIYRFSNEDITAYYHHLKDKENVLTVIGSGGQVLNGILAGTRKFDCFDISIFSEYYLYLQLASIKALTKEEYLDFYFSDDKDKIFNNDIYDKISIYLSGKYKIFWDELFAYNEGYDLFNSLLFRHDICIKDNIIETNPYLQNDNYDKLKNILLTENIEINTLILDITNTKIDKKYDLVNLSNILSYYYTDKELKKYIDFLKSNFELTDKGEIINYLYKISEDFRKKAAEVSDNNSYIEDIDDKSLFVHKK